MQKDSTLVAQVNRIDAEKANRMRVVQSLPDSGIEGDDVMMGDVPYRRIGGAWVHLDEERFQAIERRLDALEASNG